MANAAINILSDGSIYDLATIHGSTESVVVTHVGVGRYELTGTRGMVPPPDGWGVVTNPMDKISAAVSFVKGALLLDVLNADDELIDIPSKVTLHIVVDDAPLSEIPTPPEPDPAAEAVAEYIRRRAQADFRLQPLQDLLDIDEGTPEVEAKVLEWKRYRVALSRVGEQAGYPHAVEWPVVPE